MICYGATKSAEEVGRGGQMGKRWTLTQEAAVHFLFSIDSQRGIL